MQCENFKVSIPVDLNGLPLFKLEPMTLTDHEKLVGMVNRYVDNTKKMNQLENQLEIEETRRVHLMEQAKAQAAEAARIKVLHTQARVDTVAAEVKLANSTKMKEESDRNLQVIRENKTAATEKRINTTQKVKIDELRRAFKVTEEQVLATLDQSQFDLLKTVQAKRCLSIDEVAMKLVLLPLMQKYNVLGANLAAFKDEITEQAIVTFFANLPSTKIRSILIAKPLSAIENAAKAQIEALIAQRGGSIKVS